ncbi:MAG: hypothetical protein H0X05_05590 [Actinobacteria bacterium]|nr:hypothetical protein [Actinomycetota bacterium]
MAVMVFPIGLIISFVALGRRSPTARPTTIAAQGHLVTAVNFIGFASVFAAISFAIARILGEFRVGGGALQQAARRQVKTLKMPGTAKIFLGLMMMAMMTLLAAVVLHFVAASSVTSGTLSLEGSEQWALRLEGVRRTGVATYLLGIVFGLATIVRVLRFQSSRLQELPGEVAVGS